MLSDRIFVDPQERTLTGIIDFTDVEIADPTLDFAGMWDYGEGFVQMVSGYYANKTDKDFLSRSEFPELAHNVGNMLEIANREGLLVTFEEYRERLSVTTRSMLTL